jgi:hypothetical protein
MGKPFLRAQTQKGMGWQGKEISAVFNLGTPQRQTAGSWGFHLTQAERETERQERVSQNCRDLTNLPLTLSWYHDQ